MYIQGITSIVFFEKNAKSGAEGRILKKGFVKNERRPMMAAQYDAKSLSSFPLPLFSTGIAASAQHLRIFVGGDCQISERRGPGNREGAMQI